MAKIAPITTDAEHATALARIDALMNCDGPEAVELTELAALVEAYEEHRFPLTMASPPPSAPAAEGKPKKPPAAGRWCPYCGDGVILEYTDGQQEQCLNCGWLTLTSRERTARLHRTSAPIRASNGTHSDGRQA